MNDKPLILITNDDSIDAPGIRALAEAVIPLGKVVVVASDKPQSAKGHAITMDAPLRVNKVHFIQGTEAYKCSGTPVDCVKFARNKLLKKLPDICLSGINHGANNSINVFYSGTMSAAMEAALLGIPAIGFSLLDHALEADFTFAGKIARELTGKFLKVAGPGALLNVNIPKIPEELCKGIRICRQAKGRWKETFEDRKDPFGKTYYWLSGEFQNLDKGEDTDVWALENNYVSVVPTQYDLTDYKLKKKLESSWL